MEPFVVSTSTVTPVSAAAHDPEAERDFEIWRERMASRFTEVLTQHGPHLYQTTNSDALVEVYLESFPDAVQRQYHNCGACKHFLRRYGGLVAIDERGVTHPVFWDPEGVPERYADAAARLFRAVRYAPIVDVFVSDQSTWGSPRSRCVHGPDWTHFFAVPPKSIRHRDGLRTSWQRMAERREEHSMLRRALADFPLELLDRAVTLLEADVLYRSEKVLGVATWFRDLQRNLGVKGIRRSDTRDNLIWRAVATAPPGFCHVRSSMIGTLLEDLAAGMSIDEVTWRFAEKMHPLRYQRPQVAPSAGNIARAEEIVAKLGIASSLKRRFARADEIEAIWTPAPSPAPVGSGVFGHIKPKDAAPTLVPMRLPQRPITWAKFRDEVLPKAHALRYYTGSGGQPFAALTTAVDPDAPPILQWDHADRRNPVAWFFRHPEHAQTPEAWGLAACTWTRVTAVAYKPCMWGADPSSSTHHGRGVLFVLDGCEVPNKAGGLALFPECLASSLREVRSTIEAYSQKGTLEDIGGPYACGIMVNEGATWLVPLEVDTGDGTLAEYLLDRWD